MSKKFLVFSFAFLLSINLVYGLTPENVNYLKAEITRTGYVYLKSVEPGARAEEVKIYLSIPQETGRQSVILKEVSGPDTHEFETDEYGNQILKLIWNDPPLNQNLEYNIKFEVEVFDKEINFKANKFPETDLIKTNPEIMEKSYELERKGNDIYQIFELAKWVNNWVKYDKSYENVTKPSTWVFKNKKGTCDEISNLLITMLRNLGYNAYYVAGYAYSDNWGPHSWVEVNLNGKIITVDPTWLESPIDATHISFSRLPDSNYTEEIKIRKYGVNFYWEKGKVDIKILKKREKERINEIRFLTIPENLKDDSYVLFSGNFFSDNCLLTKSFLKSCVYNGKDLIDIFNSNISLGFCNNKTIYWIGKIPELEKNMRYTCPLVVYGNGKSKMVNFDIIPGERNKLKLSLSLEKILIKDQNFTLTLNVENPGEEKEYEFYLFLNGEVFKKKFNIPSGKTKIYFNLIAPAMPKDYTLYLFSSSGDLVKENLTVISERYFKIIGIEIPKEMKVNGSYKINITFKNQGPKNNGKIIFRANGRGDVLEFVSEENETKKLSFNYIPENYGKKVFEFILLSNGYQDGWVGSVEIKKETSLFESILNFFQSIINSILKLFNF